MNILPVPPHENPRNVGYIAIRSLPAPSPGIGYVFVRAVLWLWGLATLGMAVVGVLFHGHCSRNNPCVR